MTPQLPFDPENRTLLLRGAPVSYTDDGTDGPTFVCVHGLPGSVRDFRWLGAALRERSASARAVRIDMPGFGGTDASLGGDMSTAARARFVSDVLTALELDDVILLGHSIGGPVAIGATALAVERIRGLALVASVGLSPHRVYRAMPHPRVFSRIVCSPFGRRFLSGRLRRSFQRIGFPDSTPTEELFATMRVVGALRFAAVRSYATEIAERGIQAHVFIAEDDPLVELAIAEELAEELQGTLHIFDTGGHNIQKSRAAEITEALVEFRASLAGESAATPVPPDGNSPVQ